MKPHVVTSSKNTRLLPKIFIIFGVAMLLGSVYQFMKTTRFLATAEKTSAVVNRLEIKKSKDSQTYAPEFQFEVNGTTYTNISKVYTNPTSYKVGDKIEVYYDPQQPSSSRINNFIDLWIFSVALLGIGSVIIGIGFFTGRASQKKKADEKRLQQVGVRIEAMVTDVVDNNFVRAGKNRTRFWKIRAQWHDPKNNIMHTFDSERIYTNPKTFVETSTPVPVIIDPSNPQIYKMDISGFNIPTVKFHT